ncbi:MAG: DUF2235 domain-containing protein [Ectothiorhodospiraceae bacterium]|nr:DUF2235 domain-containing protein [Ectothiorhodospiraceae bacterium]
MKRIVICFDGTWNTPNDDGDVESGANTNVRKLYLALSDQDDNGVKQHAVYIRGVGDRWYNRLRGGALGVGLDRRIKEGYEELVASYDDGDEIYVIGFSRGAYSARSLVGMIRNVGLLQKSHRKEIHAAYELYRTRDEGADSPVAEVFRERYSREVGITCLGVWDTVGALGVPLNSFNWFNARRYQFHDTELSGIVENAFHAVAVDEHRASFAPTLWSPRQKPDQRMEQVWFCGAHADVGGGYHRAELSDIPLLWMAERLKECGLAFREDKLPRLSPSNVLAEPHDSFGAFMKGAYQLISSRSYRTVGETRNGEEHVSDTVQQRLRKLRTYRPINPIGAYLRLEGMASASLRRLRDLASLL